MKKEKVKNEKPRKKVAFVICIVFIFIFMLAISGIANAGVTGTYSEESEAVKVLWDESHGAHSSYKLNERFSTIRENLEINGFQLDEFTTGPITAEILSNYDILVVGTLTSNWNSSHTSAEITAITDYVTYGGGSLLMFGENTDCPNRNINSLANRFGVTFGQSDTGAVSITNLGTHEIFDGINSIFLHTGATMDVRAPSTAAAWYNNEPIVATYAGAIFIGDCNWLCDEYIHDEDNLQFGENVFNWLAKKGPVVSISTDKFKYCPGDTMLVTVGISNPTSDPVTFKGYLGIPTSDIWLPVTSVPIPAGFEDTIGVTLHVGTWSETPFSAVWYVDLQDPETGQELAADCACWSYCPTYGEEATTMPMSMPTLLEDIAKEIGEEIEGSIT